MRRPDAPAQSSGQLELVRWPAGQTRAGVSIPLDRRLSEAVVVALTILAFEVSPLSIPGSVPLVSLSCKYRKWCGWRCLLFLGSCVSKVLLFEVRVEAGGVEEAWMRKGEGRRSLYKSRGCKSQAASARCKWKHSPSQPLGSELVHLLWDSNGEVEIVAIADVAVSCACCIADFCAVIFEFVRMPSVS